VRWTVVAICIALLVASATGGVVLLIRNGTTASTAPTPGATTSLSTTLLARPQTAGVSVDPAAATSVVDAVWPVREKALVGADAATIRDLETGPALEWDLACYDGCQPTSARPLDALRVFVPRQSSYPAAFLAEVRTVTNDLSEPYIEMMIFTRASAALPWILNFDTGYSEIPTMSEQPAADSHGFDAAAPSFADVTISDLPSQLAAYWQYWKDNGAAPPGNNFGDGTWTDEWGQYISSYAQQLPQGLSEDATYTADPTQDGQWTFAIDDMIDGQLVDGMALSCSTVRFTSAISAYPGFTITQPADQSAWSYLLPAGSYSELHRVGIHQSCFLLEPGTASIGVVGGNGGDTQVTGLPVGAANTA
jgi:hypothetical protein